MDTAEPNRANDLRDKDEPRPAKPKTDSALLIREKLRSDTEDPNLDTAMIDRENTDPKRAAPSSETDELSLPKRRTDKVEPKVLKARTASEAPTRAKLRIDKADPK